jgi:hypothetical protein
MSTDIPEIFRQYSFLSSVLAGFAITVAIELIALGKKGRVASSAIAAFLISSVGSVVITFIFVVLMAAMLGPAGPGYPRPSDEWIMHFVGGMGILPLAGLVLFLVGIALTGWLHSKVMGIITTVAVALAFALVIYILRTGLTVR